MPEDLTPEELKPVNLPFTPPDWVGEYKSAYTFSGDRGPSQDYRDVFQNLLNQAAPKNGGDFPAVATKDIDFSGRYPLYFPGRDNEEMYAQSQSGFDKAYNGVVKFAGTATSTFINGTAGLVYGIGKSIADGDFTSFWNNPLSRELNEWTQSLEDKYAHYKTERERNGNWWEPSNLFTGNFLWDNIVKNLGFSVGTIAGGFAWGGLLKAVGATSRLVGAGQKMAAAADDIISQASTLPEVDRLATINSRLSGLLTQTKGAIGRGLMQADRGIVATFGTVGEAGLESLNNAQQFRKNMIDEFIATRGYEPNEQELAEIDNAANSVGNWSFLTNTALLTATNYIQLPKIFSSSFKSEKQILDDVAFRGGKYASTLPEKGFGKLLYKTKNVASLFFNTSEAFEEGAQFAIQTGTQNYFGKKAKGEKDVSVLDDGILFGIKEALTTNEGTLNIFTGGFSGALQSSGFVGVKGGLPAFGKTGKIGARGFTGYGGEQKKVREEAISALNKSLIKDKMKDAYTNLKAAAIIQEEREAAIRRGDILESKDLEFDYAHTFIASRLKYNAKEAITEEVNSLKQEAMTGDGFLRLQREGYVADTDTQPSFINRLDNLQKHADTAAKLQDSLNLKYKGIVNSKTGQRLYSDEVIDKLVYAGSKLANYDDRIPQVSQSLLDKGINIATPLEDVLIEGVPKEEVVQKTLSEIDALKKSLTDDEILDLKRDFRDLLELGIRRKQFLNEYNDISKNPLKYTTAPQKPSPETKDKGPITTTTPSGEMEFEVGKQYYVGAPIKRTKKGVKHEKFSRFIVLGESPDGKMVIQVSSGDPSVDGEIFEVKKDFFADMDINDISTVEDKPNAKFYTEVAGKTFRYQLGKGKFLEGEIRYDSKTGRLFFVTSDGKKKYGVTRSMFKPKEGYDIAKIYTEEELSERAIEALDAAISEEDLIAQFEERDAILGEAVANTKQKLDKVTADLESAKESLKKTEEEIAKLTTTKTGEPRTKFTKANRKALDNLRKLHKFTSDSIESLTEERDNLQELSDYFQELYDNRGNLPDTFDEAMKGFKQTLVDLKDIVADTSEAIKNGEKLIEQVESAIETAMSLLNDYIKRLREENPGVPMFLEDLINQVEKYLGPEGAKNYIQERAGFTEAVMDLEDQISEFSEELKLPNMTSRANKLREQVKELEAGLNELATQAVPKEAAINALATIAEDYRKRVQEEERLAKSEKLVKRFLQSAETSVQTEEYDSEYEADKKKSDLHTVTGTKVPSVEYSGQPLAAHHVRANTFGARMDNMPNRENLRGIIVTSKNEKNILPGLTQFLKDNGDKDVEVDPKQTIALVIVEVDPEDETIKRLVGVDGKPLASPDLNAAIFQVFPETLTWSDGKSMFRKSTPKEVVDDLTEQYETWREQTLNNPSTDTYSFDASFGIPEFVTYLDDEGKPHVDETAVTSVQDAGLVDENDLLRDPLIEIPTSEGDLEKGSVSFKNAIGRPFLALKNGYVKLKNRLLTKQEAATVYQAIERLATEVNENEDGIDSEGAQLMINYLRSIVYWGTPKDGKPAGRNNVFFERETVGGMFSKLTLNIGGKGYNIPFTPTAIKAKKDEIISLLENIYNNINQKMTESQWAEPFTEVISISPEGKLETREWPNYQSYLLSNKLPDGGSRNVNEIPLTTQMRPLKDADDVNRSGIYFIVDYGKEKFVSSKGVKKKRIKPGAPVEAAGEEKKVKVAPEGTFILDGETLNILVLPETKRKIYFTANKKLILEKDVKNGIKVAFGVGDAKDIQEELMKKGLTKEETLAQFRGNIFIAIKDKLAEKKKINIDTEFVIEDDEEDVAEDAEAFNKLFKKKEKKEVEEIEEEEEEENDNIEEDTDTFGEFTIEDDEELKDDLDNLDDDVPFRKIVEDRIKRFEGENWNKVEKWLAKTFPNTPVYRVKNVLRATNGAQAFGMFKNGAIYIYENAEVGTTYHEVFHAVWRMFSEADERKAILNELRSRKGTFFDTDSGQTFSYSDPKVTDRQLEEVLAEEFRDYVQFGKAPAKPTYGKNWIQRLFADLKNFIKEFFLGKDSGRNTVNLFEKITTGYYKNYSPYHASLSYAKAGIIDIEQAYASDDAAFRIANFTGEQVHDIMQEMTYLTLGRLIKNNQSLFNLPNINRQELYDDLRVQIRRTVLKLMKAAQENVKLGKVKEKDANVEIARSLAMRAAIKNDITWQMLVQKHEEYLRKYSIEFDENDEINLKDDINTGKGEYEGSDKIDHFRKANSAIKLILSTIPVVKEVSKTRPEGGEVMATEHVPSSIGGHTLLPTIEAFVKIMNKTHDSRNIEDMLARIKDMAKTDPNYRTVYTRLTRRNYTTPGIDLSNLKEPHDADLLNALWTTFKKQNPDVKNHYIRDNGDVQIGDANLATAARQSKVEMINSIIKVLKGKNKYFKEQDGKFVQIKGAIDKVPLTNMDDRINFLKTLGINFRSSDIKKLNRVKQDLFRRAVAGVKESLRKATEIYTISSKSLDIDGRLLQLGEVKAAIENPEFDTTYFGGNGERKQTFIGTNAASDFYDALSQVDNLNDIPKLYPQYAYLLTDEFVTGSVMLQRMFLPNGERRADSEDFMKASIADSTIDSSRGMSKESSKLTYRDRLIQEINMNIEGYHYALVPGDASLEWMFKMLNVTTPDSLLTGMSKVYDIFEKYLLSEIDLSRNPSRTIAAVKGRNKKDLRFFKDILGKELHDKITSQTKDKALNRENAELSAVELFAKYKDEIIGEKGALDAFIKKQTESLKDELIDYEIIMASPDGWTINNLDYPTNENVKDGTLERRLMSLTINYMVNNIELHKLLFSDPYQYSDELKRIKNFLSPRQAIMYGSKKFNAILNNVHNKEFGTSDIGRTDFTKDYFRSATLSKVYSIGDLNLYEDPFEETDGGGAIIYKAYRNFRIRSGNWTTREEGQYRYDIAWEKRDKSKGLTEKEIEKRGLKLSKKEQEILDKGNPQVMSAYTTLKPIVAGNKEDGKNYNDIVLDKFALYPLSYRIMKETNSTANAIKLYNKMQEENIDYVVFESGRKVGAKDAHSLYNPKDGSFNTEKFGKNVVVNIPFSIMSVQAEVPSKEENEVTRGTQVTKLVTLDMMEAGVPIDYMRDEEDFNERYKSWTLLETEELREKRSPLYKEIKRNQKLLEELIEEGYRNLLEKFDIKETISEDGERSYKLENVEKTIKTLTNEVLKREVNDNIISALKGFESGSAVIEATPAYQQIRNILYSIADRNVISQKINGGMKVQLPSTLLESNRSIKSEKIGDKDVYTSDILKFYVDDDGKRICEIMVSRWFDSDLSDDELLDKLNKTPEGQKILSGIAYRIPTQKQNSIDAFRIAKFLPKEFGDNVIVPSALVKKVGSDFDIDKLSMYLKNVYIDYQGVPRLIQFENIDTNNESQLKAFYERNLLERYKRFRQVEKEAGVESSVQDLLESVLNVEDLTESVMSTARFKYVPSVDEFVAEAKGMDVYELNRKFHRFNYKKVIENEYIDSLEKIVTHPLNFESLVKPNSAEELKELSGFIVDKLNLTKFDYTQVGNMLDRKYMSNLRHAFVTGKYAIGIAAVNQTNHSLNQKSLVAVDLNKLDNLSDVDRKWIKDGKLKFFTEDGEDNFNTVTDPESGEKVTTLSMIKNKAGRFISDLIAQFIDGYVDISKDPWIIQLGATSNVAGTYLFLIKAGVPIKSVVYFMNQPIIRDYLRSLENAGYTWVFNQKFVTQIKNSEKYKVDESVVNDIKAIPIESRLEKYLGQKEFRKEEKAQQQFILDEFLKYAKLAEQMFIVTQGTNFDTSNFNDPYLVLKKEQQLIKAQDTIISSVDNILNESHLGKLRQYIIRFRDAYSTILKSDQPGVRGVIQKVLLPYVNLSDREFVKVAQKAVADLFDWAVQTDFTTKANIRLNAYIERALLADDNYVRQIDEFVQSVRADENHPLYNNQIIKVLQPLLSDKVKGVDNIKIRGMANKVYDQNQIIYAFTELKNYLEGIDSTLYRKLTTVAVLQSGLSSSPISFTSLLPYEDFKDIYNTVLSQLDEVPDLDMFYKLHIFERNNWANDDIIPHSRAKLFESKSGDWFYNTNMNFLPAPIRKAIDDEKIPQLLTMSKFTREGNYDFIVYNWEDESIPLKDRQAMKRKSDFSYMKRGLFKKVKDKYGNPLIYLTESKGVTYENFVYQAVNAWGDSFRAKEFYTTARQSKIDNGFIKVKEVSDSKIIPYFTERKITAEEEAISTAQDFPTVEIDEFTIQLKDGNYYLKDQITAKFLEKLNYSRSEIGNILTKLC